VILWIHLYGVCLAQQIMNIRILVGLLAVLVVSFAAACDETGPDTSATTDATAEPTVSTVEEATPTPEPTPTPVPPPTPTPTPLSVSALEVMEASIAAMDALASFRFDLDIVASMDSEGSALEVPIQMTGSYVAPDSVEATLAMDLLFITIETEYVSLGDTQYVMDPLSGEWQVTVDAGGTIIDPASFVIQEASGLRDLVLSGLEVLDGVDTYRLTATSVDGAFGGVAGEFALIIWVRTSDGLVAKIVAEGEAELGLIGGDLLGDIGQESAMMTITLALSGFGEDIIIEPPVAAQAPSPTATAGPAATSTAATGPPPSQAVDDADALLARINATMEAVEALHFTGEVAIKESPDAESALLSITFEGDSAQSGDTSMIMNMGVDLGGFAANFAFETREVGGVIYDRNPLTNEWQITDESSAPLSSELTGPGAFDNVQLDGMSVVFADLDGLTVYRISGTVPDEPDVETMVLWVGTEDLLVRRFEVVGRMAAAELEGLVAGDAGELSMSSIITFSEFGEPKVIEAPNVD
jgi:hypothetical protein